jgi:hypothetical protein
VAQWVRSRLSLESEPEPRLTAGMFCDERRRSGRTPRTRGRRRGAESRRLAPLVRGRERHRARSIHLAFHHHPRRRTAAPGQLPRSTPAAINKPTAGGSMNRSAV